MRFALLFVLLIAPSRVLSAATLRRGEIQTEVLRQDGTRAVEKVTVWNDDFTKLVLYTNRLGEGRTQQRAIQEALAILGAADQHCAIRAVRNGMRSKPGKDDGVKDVQFGESFDPHGHYDSRTGVIVANHNTPYLLDPQNLARLLYHEGLHHLEYKHKLRHPNEGSGYHDSRRIKTILRAELGENHACLNFVQDNGTLINGQNAPLEPNYDASVDRSLRQDYVPPFPGTPNRRLDLGPAHKTLDSVPSAPWDFKK